MPGEWVGEAIAIRIIREAIGFSRNKIEERVLYSDVSVQADTANTGAMVAGDPYEIASHEAMLRGIVRMRFNPVSLICFLGLNGQHLNP